MVIYCVFVWGGGGVPWGRRHWVGINFCSNNVTCKILFLIYPRPLVSFIFFWERERGQYPGDSNRRIERKNENDNPVRKWYICSSIITLMFGFFMALGHSG